jgi:hypothetical protein
VATRAAFLFGPAAGDGLDQQHDRNCCWRTLPEGVAQIFNLLYRRFLICSAPELTCVAWQCDRLAE